MKKCLALLFLMIAVLFLYACTPEEPTTVPGTTQQPGTTAPTTAAPTAGPTTAPTLPPVTQPPVTTPPTVHTHEFGPWIVIQKQTCQKPEISTHICACHATEEIVTKDVGDHTYGIDGQCATCERRISMGLAYQLSEDGASYILISRHECVDDVIIIPETYDGLPVSGIGYAAFALGEMSSVEIPDTVTSIADNAFQDCYRLEQIRLPEGLVSIGDWAFSGTALETVHLPGSVRSIGREAFQNCERFTGFTVAEENTSFRSEDGVLLNKAGTALLVYPAGKQDGSYVLPETVTVIGDYAFLGCHYVKQVQLPEGLVSIGTAAFAGSGISSVTIPASVETIGFGAFGIDREAGLPGDGCCGSLAEILVNENNAVYKSIDGVLLTKDGTTLLVYPAGKEGSSYTTPAGVTTIGESAFVGCGKLRDIVLSEGVTSIGRYAFSAGFYKSNQLESITIAATVMEIGDYALAYCENLTDIYYAADSWQWLVVTKGQEWDTGTGNYIMHYTE